MAAAVGRRLVNGDWRCVRGGGGLELLALGAGALVGPGLDRGRAEEC